MTASPVRLLLLADSTVDPIIPLLTGEGGAFGAVDVVTAPYSQVHQALRDPGHAAWSPPPDLVLLWTQPHNVIASLAPVLSYRPAEIGKILDEVDAFADLVVKASAGVRHLFLVSWALPPHLRGMQTLALRHNTGLANILLQMNLRLAENVAPHERIVLLDAQYWYASVAAPAFDPRLWALGRIAYSRELFETAAREVNAIYRGLTGRSRRLVVSDLDNTLWGGILGDDGPEHLALGAPDPVGESFVEVQRVLKGLQETGVLLALASKNDETLALDTIAKHPQMVLRPHDFVGWRIDWNDKAQNILDLVKELNLGLESVVYLDDSPWERDRIRQALPEVLVPELPAEYVEVPAFLAALDCFERPALTDEDRARTALYRQEGQRRSALQQASSLEEWLRSLEIEVTAFSLDRAQLPRATQLLAKTNQFNQAGRRLSEDELWAWAQAPDHRFFVFHVRDRFGDQGLCGALSYALHEPDAADIVDFVMSCRVMGKQIEHGMLAFALARLRERGVRHTRAACRPTPRNKPFLDFITSVYAAGEAPVLDAEKIAVPPHVRLRAEAAAA